MTTGVGAVMAAEPTPLRAQLAAASPSRGRRLPAQSARRRVEELLRGNTRALRHGVQAQVLNRPDVMVEVALIFAARPALDPIRDARLVEQLATVTVQRARCLEALGDRLADLDRQQLSTLTSYDGRLSPLQERLERAVHEREQLRIRERTDAERRGDLGRYRSDGGSR